MKTLKDILLLSSLSLGLVSCSINLPRDASRVRSLYGGIYTTGEDRNFFYDDKESKEKITARDSDLTDPWDCISVIYGGRIKHLKKGSKEFLLYQRKINSLLNKDL